DDPRIIYQKDFTAIGTSTGNDLWLEDGRIQGDHPANGDYLNQALIVQVSEHDVLIYRRDIHNNDWPGDPFHLRFPPEGTPMNHLNIRMIGIRFHRTLQRMPWHRLIKARRRMPA